MQKKCRKASVLKKVTNFLTAAAIAAMSVTAIPAGAAGYCDAEMYIPASADQLSGVVGGWESTETPAANMPDAVKDSFSNALSSEIRTESGSYWLARWGTAAQHRYNMESGTVTVQYPANQADQVEHLMLGKAVAKSDITHVVIGASSNTDTNGIAIYCCQDWEDYGSTSVIRPEFKKGSHEYIIPIADANLVDSIDNLRIEIKTAAPSPVEIEFSYIRFINSETYDGYIYNSDRTGTLVENGAVDYDVENNVVDFMFIDNMDPETVTAENVTINDQPVKWVMMSSVGYAFRVNLGLLKKNTTYTIRFNGVKTTDGNDVGGEFTFSTPYAETENVIPKMYLQPDESASLIGGWDSEETPNADMNDGVKDAFSNAGWFDIKTSSGNWWKTDWDTAANHKYNTAGGTVSVQYPKGQSADSWEAFQLNTAISAAEIKYIAIGVSSNIDTTRVRMYACTSDWNDGGSLRSAGLNIKAGDNELICPVSAADQPWAADNTIYNWDNSLDISKLKFTADANLADDIELTFKYVRFECEPTVKGEEIANGATGYSIKNNVVDFVFPEAMKKDTVTASRVTINDQSVQSVTALEDGCSFRIDLGTLRRGETYTVRFDGAEKTDGTLVNGEFTFTTQEVQTENVTPKMYLLSDTSGSDPGSWENTETPNADMNDGVKDAFSNAGWFDIKTSSGNWWKTDWDTAANHKYNTADGTVTVQYPKGQSADSWEALQMSKGIPAADVKYIAIGVSSNIDTTRVRMYACTSGWDDGGSLRSAGLNIKAGDNELICPISAETQPWAADNTIYNWDNSIEISKLKFMVDANLADDIELTFKYVRFVCETTEKGEEIANNATDYSIKNNVVDFVFPEALKADTVKTSNVTINGKSVRSVKAMGSGDTFRVDLGTLSKSTTYTVRFDGAEKEDGTIVTGEFTFTTMTAKTLNVTPTLYKADRASIIGGWESTETLAEGMNEGVIDRFSNAGWYDIKMTSGSYWKYGWYTSIEHRYNTKDGTVSLRFNPKYTDEESGNDANPDTTLVLGTPVNTAEVKYVIIGAYSNADSEVTVYYNKQGSGVGDSADRAGSFSFKEGFNEYVCPISADTDWGGLTQLDQLRFSHAPSGFDPFEIKFSYIRFADENYKVIGTGEKIEYTPFMTYDPDAAYIDFVFPNALNQSTVTAENVTLNGCGADAVITDPENPKVFRAYFSAIKPMVRFRLDVSGVEDEDGNELIVDGYHFTAGTKEDTTGSSSPIMTWELVENYQTADEAPLTSSTVLNGKTVTAVTGGLYNNSGEAAEYTLALARYKDGKLDDLEFKTVQLAAYQMVGEQTVETTVPDDGNTYTLKAFAWNNMKPLCRAVTSADSTISRPLKLLILGNSITYHAPVASYGWYGYWGMAASSQDKDYVHQLTSSVREQYPMLRVKYQNIATIENNYFESIAPQVQEDANFKECADYQADIIIVTIGANIHNENGHTFDKAKYEEIINAFRTNPDAKVIVGATTLTGSDIMSVLASYASENGMPFVDMVYSRSDNPEYFPADDEYTMFGVCLHPNDAGMKAMADDLEPVLLSVINSYNAN